MGFNFKALLKSVAPIAAGLLEQGGTPGKIAAAAIGTVVGVPNLQPEQAESVVEAKLAETPELYLKLKEIDANLQIETRKSDTEDARIAGENIRAETTSEDKFTKRARPAFGYAGIAIIFNNYVLFPWVGKPPIDLPEAFFYLFGSWLLGYGALRTWEKVKGKAL